MASKRIQNFENGQRASVGYGISTSAVQAQRSSAGRFVAWVFLAVCVMAALAMVGMAGAL